MSDPLSVPQDDAEREEQIRERLAKATPGEWVIEVVRAKGAVESDSYNILTGEGGWVAYDVFGGAVDEPTDANLIANAPSDLRFLLARVDDLREALREANEDRTALIDRHVGIIQSGFFAGCWYCIEADNDAFPTADEALAAYRSASPLSGSR